MNVVKISNVGGIPFIRDGFEAERRVKISLDIDGFMERVKLQPKYSHLFHAYSFHSWNLSLETIQFIVDVARKTHFSLRCWKNNESAMILFCFADPDLSENSGWGIYETMQQIKYDSYGMPSGYEWDAYGLEIDPAAAIAQTNDRAVTIGEVGIIF